VEALSARSLAGHAQRRRTLTFMSLNAHISRHMRSAVAAADRPVFVDSTGHRARLFRRTGYGLAALASTYVVVLGLSLLGATPFAPGVLLPVPGVSGGPAAPAAPAVPGPGALGQVPPLSGGAPGVGGRMAGDSGTVTGGPPGVFPPPVPGTSSFISAPVPPATAGPAAPQGPVVPEAPQVPDAPQAPGAPEAPESPVPPPDPSPAPDAPSPVPAPDTGTPPGAPLPQPAPETPLPTPSAATPQAPSEGPPEGSSSVPPSGVPAAQAP
jgi:hypothetical protein